MVETWAAMTPAIPTRTRRAPSLLRRLVAALTLALLTAAPGTARANKTWDAITEEWGRRPVAVIFAIPALLITAPFMLATAAYDSLASDEDEAEDE